ncbi:MAG: hypothetical protein WC567_06140, partial [Kiritimatiellia bacterium]
QDSRTDPYHPYPIGLTPIPTYPLYPGRKPPVATPHPKSPLGFRPPPTSYISPFSGRNPS